GEMRRAGFPTGASGMSIQATAIDTLKQTIPGNPQTAAWRRLAARATYLSLMLVAAIAAFFANVPRLVAQTPPVQVARFVTPAEMKSGSLLLRSDGDRFVEAPLIATDVNLVVSGATIRARVSQIFH